MPNWVYNYMRVSGNKEERKRFKEYVKTKDKVLDHDKIIPYPEKFKEQDKTEKYHELKEKKKLSKEDKKFLMLCELENFEGQDGYNQGGYDWCCSNWGTKWGFCYTELISETNRSLFYTFDTAWSFPTPLMITMSKMFPKLTFKIFTEEESKEFKGTIVFNGGEIIKDNIK